MSRRDTIIIAVLVNLGLLAVLFMTAIHLDEDGVSDSMETPTSLVGARSPDSVIAESSLAFTSKNTGDELDDALQDFVSTAQLRPVTIEEEVTYIDPPSPIVVANKVTTTDRKDPTDPSLKYVEVTVKKGDVLEKIARANGTTVAAIKEANQMKNEKLSIGKVLRIPVAKTKSDSTKEVAITDVLKPLEVASEYQYYTIKTGDNPWKIAKQFKLKVDDLLKMNGLNEEKARNLKVGDKIRVK